MRVVLAMSGGVDSSVAALLLKQQGHEVIGLFMRTGVHEEHAGPAHKKGCCSSLDAGDARRVADLLDIPFYALDFSGEFGRIMDYFADEYIAGRTPNPCVVCNNWLKFGKLWSYGKQLDADRIATGHYSRIEESQGAHEMHMALDPAKDQSYVLAGLRRSLLSKLLFPVGSFPKEQIRDLARAAGLPVFAKPDSQEICFVPDNDYAGFIAKHRPGLETAGDLVDTNGNVLGPHDGYQHFTIGQRKGLNYAAGERRFVLKILPATRQVVVGTRAECHARSLLADPFNWLIEPPTQPRDCQAKIRYRTTPVPAVVVPLPESQAVRVVFREPQLAITPGQAVVCYESTKVLGGGWIREAADVLPSHND
jgi:tRNA-specific 2-thiouridylase